MKVILSRKGFDTQYGGYPSPILPNGRMLSLPIPSNDLLTYSRLKLEYEEYRTYYDLMTALKSTVKKDHKWIELTKNTRCHCDPDINSEILERPENWKPIFGQVNAAQSHLEKEGVKEGDLFLFYGTFRETIKLNDQLKFNPKSREKHVIFGFLQIGQIIQAPNEDIYNWINYHPHIHSPWLRNRINNTIYIASDKLSFNEKIPGAGAFNFNKNLILTKTGYSKSRWDLPPFFRNLRLSRHTASSWKAEYFQSVAVGQEFVIEEHSEITNWAKILILNNFKSNY